MMQAQTGRRLGAADKAWLAGLCGPTLLFAFALKLSRLFDLSGQISNRPSSELSIPAVAEFFASDLAMWFTCVTAVALALSLSTGIAKTLCRFASQLSALFYLTLVQSMHAYFKTTGSSLDFDHFQFGIASLANGNAALLGSEISLSRAFGYGSAVLAVLFLPWFLSRKWQMPDEPARVASNPRWLALGVTLGTVGIIASTAAGGRFGRDIARDPLLHLIVTANANWWATHGTSLGDTTGLRDYPTGATALRPLDPSADRPRKNLVIIMLESTGYISTSMAGRYETTPFLQELYSKGVVPERMVSVVPHTSKALLSILCGIEPRPGFGTPEVRAGGIPGRCLPGLLREQGYQTVMMQAAKSKFEQRRDLIRELEFEFFTSGEEMDESGFAFANYFGHEDRIMLAPSREWLTNRRDPTRPFLFAYLTNAPHHNYLKLDHYGFKNFGADQFELDSPQNRYLNSVRYIDFVVREIMGQYQELGLLSQTIFMILGDHGEAFGEHDRRSHDEVPYEEVMRIPMVLYEPGGALQAKVLPGVFSQLDIVPTALERLGFESVAGTYPGRSILSDRDEPERGPERVIFASCYAARKCLARWQGNLKFIHFFGLRPDLLFDLSTDPDERNNLASSRPHDSNRYADELLAWRETLWSLYGRSIDLYVTSEPPEIQHPLEIQYGESVILLGYSIDPAYVIPGQSITITYYFRVLKPLPEGYEVFVHARDGEEVHGWKHVPVMSLYPEALWKAGDYISDPHHRVVGKQWRSDRLELRLGFKHPTEPKLESIPPAENNAPWIIDLEVRHDLVGETKAGED